MLAPEVLLQGRDLLLQEPDLEHLAHRQGDLGGGERFGDVIGGPSPDGLDGRVDGGVGGDDDDLEPRRGGQKGRDEVEAVVRAQTEIHEGELEGPVRGLRQGVLEVADSRDFMSFRLESDGQGLPDVDLVVDDEDMEGGSTIGPLFSVPIRLSVSGLKH